MWGCGYLIPGVAGHGLHNEPVKIKGLQNIKYISAGGEHALAVDKNGLVWAWGDNKHGQLGNKEVINFFVQVKFN